MAAARRAALVLQRGHGPPHAQAWRAHAGCLPSPAQGLTLLGADTRNMEYCNGKVVDNATAKDWARRLQEGME